MKILGESKESLIIEIHRSELDRLLGTFYRKNIPGSVKCVDDLKGGDEVDVMQINSMTSSLASLLSSYKDAYNEYKQSSDLVMKFVELVSDSVSKEDL